MCSLRSTALSLSLLLAIFPSLIGCNRTPPQKTETIVEEPIGEIYTPSEGSVGFQILSQGSSDGMLKWLATYTEEGGRTTRFRIELGADKGQLISEEGSDPVPLLEAMKTALRVKQLPTTAEKIDAVPFDFEMIGDSQARSADGKFTKGSGGGWVVMKIALGNSKAKMFFNFNPSMHEAEFAIADPKRGDAVLAELAKVM